MTDAVLSPQRSSVAGNPWLVAAVVVVPTFMEVLDTTIAVVALRYIAGGLSATVDDGEWVLTSYLAANAIILPITGWLSAHLGRRNYFLASIAIFTLSSALCGLAGSLGQLILFRVVQGLAGGGLQPSSQAVLLDAFPPEKQGVAMTLFGLAALLAPVIGPTLGGWLTDEYQWRWVFLINVPIGLLAFAGCYALLRDPDYLTKERMELRRKPFHFDSIGLSLLVIVMVCWEVMLSKGQQWDWLGDPFWRVQTLATLFTAGLVGLIFWELRSPNPVVNFRPLAERNFGACCIIIFCAYAVLYAASTSLPGLLQSLFGYNALNAGLVMSPSGFFAVLAMPVVGFMLGRRTDARWLIGAGLLLMAIGNYWMSQMNLFISPGQVVWPRVSWSWDYRYVLRPQTWLPTLYADRIAWSGCRLIESCCAMREAALERRWRRPYTKGAINSIRCASASTSIHSIQPHNPSLSRLKRVSCSRPEIRLQRSNWRCRHSRTCASSKRPRWPISMSFGCWPW